MRNNQLQPSAKKVQAREAAPKQKKATAHGRGKLAAADANNENVDPTGTLQPNRRSSRLHGNASDSKATAPRTNQRGGRKPQHDPSPSPPVDDIGSGVGRQRPVTSTGKNTTLANVAVTWPSRETSPTHSPTTADGNNQSQLGDLDEIQDLRRQLQEEKGHSLRQTSLRIHGLTNFQTRTGCCVALPPHRFQRQFQSPKDLWGRPVSVSSLR
jgi:hypothetical protein